jgi:hydrogenase maturation factor
VNRDQADALVTALKDGGVVDAALIGDVLTDDQEKIQVVG